MKKIRMKNKINVSTQAVILGTPYISFAMTMDIKKTQEEVHVNDVIIFDVYINTEDKEINVVDGSLKIDGNFEIQTLSTAGSVFNLWPNKPVYSEGKISFVGGTASGVSGSNLKVFSIALKPLNTEKIIFSSENMSLYLNDGSGTRIILEKINTNFDVVVSNGENKNELEKIISEDKTPPEDFEVIIGRDQNIFDGKYFISFNTVDNQSGINKYEVIEEGYDSQVAENTYVLQNQNLNAKIIVNAIDNAGNIRSVKINDVTQSGITLLLLSIFIVLLVISYVAHKFFRRKNKKS
jgi:hypothetical protein